MSSVLITSTMKSEPGVPLSRDGKGAAPVSAAATWAFGGSADGSLGWGSAAVAALAGLTAPLAPATAAAVRNFRRLSFRLASFLGISSPLGIVWLLRRGSEAIAFETTITATPRHCTGHAGGMRPAPAGAVSPPQPCHRSRSGDLSVAPSKPTVNKFPPMMPSRHVGAWIWEWARHPRNQPALPRHPT